jgi:hypothetical protein
MIYASGRCLTNNPTMKGSKWPALLSVVDRIRWWVQLIPLKAIMGISVFNTEVKK